MESTSSESTRNYRDRHGSNTNDNWFRNHVWTWISISSNRNVQGAEITPPLPISLLGENKEETLTVRIKFDSARAIPSRYNVNHPWSNKNLQIGNWNSKGQLPFSAMRINSKIWQIQLTVIYGWFSAIFTSSNEKSVNRPPNLAPTVDLVYTEHCNQQNWPFKLLTPYLKTSSNRIQA